MSITQSKVAVITVTFNSHLFIKDYLTSISSFIKNSPHILVIVDNASTDNTCDIIRQHIFDHKLDSSIHLVELTENIGFGKGCNKGAFYAEDLSPTHLWFLNPDTEILENSGTELLRLFSSKPNADFAGSLLTNKEGKTRAGAFRFPGIINTVLSTLKLGVLDKLFSSYTTATPIKENPFTSEWLTGASFMVKSASFYDLKGFDPYYFLYFEEVDLFFRAKKKGKEVWACPTSKVFHISGASTGINKQEGKPKTLPDYWYESRRYFYLNNYGKGYFAAIDLTLLLCLSLWKIRCKLQHKTDLTPPKHAAKIIAHSILPFRGPSTISAP